MTLSRRDFIKRISAASLVMAGGNVITLSAADAASVHKNSSIRFAIASDGHYGEKGTESDLFYETLVKQVSDFHADSKLDFCIINGDIIHDEKKFLTLAKGHLDKLPLKYYVTKGNHDQVSDEYWNEVWGMPVNHDVSIKNNSFLMATTSNEKGEYLSPDLNWLKVKLDANKMQDNVFIFIHIPQMKWTKYSIETPAFFELLKQYKNVRGVFHGHEHGEDGVKMAENIPFMFDSHFGGSWGTTYRGFRVVELVKKNSFLTYIMNPTEKINQAAF